ncbi:metallophosphoesterase [Alkalicella caledoniensis]|uniref:Phosphoesterase n=1 Tax=Alkalicella caledoniensis TaxID=2731377 RepID=A0A7G9W4R1_ALKCA|nr:metallophosphoesterase [Alkalicella caledoniensis]QNO13673.1 metallophosphoesterase [Alkalicella caledoniensis]
MRIAVISDTHGYRSTINKLVEIVKKYDLLLHLGDNIRDFYDIKKLSGVDGYAVVGNTDIGSKGEETLHVEIEGKKIMLTHGHKFDVKWNVDNLSYYCEEHGIDLALFGHSHVNSINEVNRTLYVNPGSPVLPRGGSKPSYASVEIKDNKIYVEIINL